VRASSRFTIVLAALTVAGCGGGCSGPSEARATSSSTQRTEASGAEARDEPAIEADPGPVPVLRITGAVDRYDRSVDLRVENRGTEEVELRARLAVEKQGGGGWEAAPAGLSLRDSCAAEAPACITLAPGAVYIPPAWTGKLGAGQDDAQCACEGCERAPAGTYRVVVTSCSGAHRVEGEPIVLPD